MCEEDRKVFTFLLTDAQRRGDAPTLCHDSFTVGIYTYNWVYARYEGLYLAPAPLGQGVRRTDTQIDIKAKGFLMDLKR